MILADLVRKLKREEETYLLELLGLTSEDIVDRFEDVIEEKFEELSQEYGEEDSFFTTDWWEDEEEDE